MNDKIAAHDAARLAQLMESDPVARKAVETIIAVTDEYEREMRARRAARQRAGRRNAKLGDDDPKADVERELRALALERLAAERQRAEIMDRTRPVILKAKGLGFGPTEIAEIVGLTRRTVYDILRKAEQG